jgi:hypothetical protein
LPPRKPFPRITPLLTLSLLSDNSYLSNNSSGGSLLNSTVNKLHSNLQQQQQNQPSTSRIITTQQPSSYSATANRMRMNPQGADLSESVLLPTSSTSPQTNGTMYMQQPLAVKNEPNEYGIGLEDYVSFLNGVRGSDLSVNIKFLHKSSSLPSRHFNEVRQVIQFPITLALLIRLNPPTNGGLEAAGGLIKIALAHYFRHAGGLSPIFIASYFFRSKRSHVNWFVYGE